MPNSFSDLACSVVRAGAPSVAAISLPRISVLDHFEEAG